MPQNPIWLQRTEKPACEVMGQIAQVTSGMCVYHGAHSHTCRHPFFPSTPPMTVQGGGKHNRGCLFLVVTNSTGKIFSPILIVEHFPPHTFLRVCSSNNRTKGNKRVHVAQCETVEQDITNTYKHTRQVTMQRRSSWKKENPSIQENYQCRRDHLEQHRSSDCSPSNSLLRTFSLPCPKSPTGVFPVQGPVPHDRSGCGPHRQTPTVHATLLGATRGCHANPQHSLWHGNPTCKPDPTGSEISGVSKCQF